MNTVKLLLLVNMSHFLEWCSGGPDQDDHGCTGQQFSVAPVLATWGQQTVTSQRGTVDDTCSFPVKRARRDKISPTYSVNIKLDEYYSETNKEVSCRLLSHPVISLIVIFLFRFNQQRLIHGIMNCGFR